MQTNYVKIKPMSVNDVWKVRRFRTDEYDYYETELLYKLPKELIIPKGELIVYYEWGFSSNGSDYDNPIKPFQDVLQKHYKFIDSRIIDANIKKKIVKKGSDYLKFYIESANEYEFQLVKKNEYQAKKGDIFFFDGEKMKRVQIAKDIKQPSFTIID